MIVSKSLAVRCDGGHRIGLGHLIRCLALVDSIHSFFVSVTFYCLEIPDVIAKQLLAKGYGVVRLMNHQEFLTYLNKELVVILDGYNFTQAQEHQYRAKSHKLVAIDDLHNREFAADAIINHSPSAKPDQYNGLTRATLLLGERFCLLRESFIIAARSKFQKQKYLLLCVGGSDSLGLTAKILKVLLDHYQDFVVKVILGPSFQDHEKLELLLKSQPQPVNVLKSLDERQMSEVMKAADYAIVPSSGILLECVCCSCKVLTFWYADNQNELHDHLVSNFGSLSFGDNRQAFQVEKFLSSMDQLINLEVPLETSMRGHMANSSNNFRDHLIPVLA